MGPIGRPETSVTNRPTTQRNIPEEQRSHLQRGRSLIKHTSKNHEFVKTDTLPVSFPVQSYLMTVHQLHDITY